MARRPLVTGMLPRHRTRGADDAQALDSSNHLQEIAHNCLQAAEKEKPGGARHPALCLVAYSAIAHAQTMLEEVDSDQFRQDYDTLMITRTALANAHYLTVRLEETERAENTREMTTEEGKKAALAVRLEYYTPQLEDALELVSGQPNTNLTSFRSAHLLHDTLDQGLMRTDFKLSQPHKEPGLTAPLARARRASEEYKALAARFNERVGTDEPESLTGWEKVLKECNQFHLPPFGPIAGLHVAYLDSGDIDTADTYAWVAFYHKGKKHIMAMRDPFPAGTHRTHAVSIVTGASSAASDLLQDRRIPRRVTEELSLHIHGQINIADVAAQRGLHELTPQSVDAAVALAEKHGIPKSLRAAMIRTLSQDRPGLDQRFGGELMANRQTFTPEQAEALVRAAREAGVDDYAIEEIMRNGGHDSEGMGLNTPYIEDEDLYDLRAALLKEKIDEDTADTMLEGIQAPPHGPEII